MNRRAFLRTAGSAAVAGWAGGVVGCAPGAAGVSSRAGALPPLDRVGLQLSTVRELFDRDLAGTLRLVAEVGYRMVETSADLYEKVPAAELRAVLDAAGLRSTSGLYRYDALLADLDRVIAAAKTLGQEYVGAPGFPEALHQSRDGFREVADRFNQWGERVRAAGMRFSYHNHAGEFVMLGGERPAFDILLERTDPDLVTFELDLYWINKAGYDPIPYIERFPGRFQLLHLKDSTPAPEKNFAPVGEGVIDFRRILTHSATAGMRYAFVEHDRPGDPVASIRTSYANVAAMLPRG